MPTMSPIGLFLLTLSSYWRMNGYPRDCTGTNIMMDPTGLFPGSFHPVKTDRSRDFRKTATRLTREQKPPTYYLTDFGLSRQYEPQDRPPLEGIIVGGDKTAPEHKNRSGRCDPFPTDVYYLGNVFRTDFLAVRYHFVTTRHDTSTYSYGRRNVALSSCSH